MKFNFFHSMPWTHYEGVPESWPVSSGNFDGVRGKALYDDYNITGAFAVASLLALLGLVTLILKTWVARQRDRETRNEPNA